MRAHLILEGASSPCAARLPRYSFDKVGKRVCTSMLSSTLTALSVLAIDHGKHARSGSLLAVVSMPPPAVPAHATHSCAFFMLQILRPSSVLAGGAAGWRGEAARAAHASLSLVALQLVAGSL